MDLVNTLHILWAFPNLDLCSVIFFSDRMSSFLLFVYLGRAGLEQLVKPGNLFSLLVHLAPGTNTDPNRSGEVVGLNSASSSVTHDTRQVASLFQLSSPGEWKTACFLLRVTVPEVN